MGGISPTPALPPPLGLSARGPRALWSCVNLWFWPFGDESWGLWAGTGVCSEDAGGAVEPGALLSGPSPSLEPRASCLNLQICQMGTHWPLGASFTRALPWPVSSRQLERLSKKGPSRSTPDTCCGHPSPQSGREGTTSLQTRPPSSRCQNSDQNRSNRGAWTCFLTTASTVRAFKEPPSPAQRERVRHLPTPV